MLHALRNWHEQPVLLAFAARPAGRVGIWVVAAVLLAWHAGNGYAVIRPFLWLAGVLVPLVTLWPGQRRVILSAGSVLALLLWLAERNLPGFAPLAPDTWARPLGQLLRYGVWVALLVGGLAAFVVACRNLLRWPRPLRDAPLLTLHGVGVGALLLVPLVSALGLVAQVLPFIIWRLSYTLNYFRATKNPELRITDHLFYMYPVTGLGMPIPKGKGLGYLGRQEVRDASGLAASQLAGLKLLGLALLWRVAGFVMDAVVHGDPQSPAMAWVGGLTLAQPTLRTLIETGATATGPALAALYLNLIRETLEIAAISHVLVGCLRLYGFRIFRDVYKPLLATTVVDFWNRRTWYLKEVLTDFFFYPVFLRFRTLGPRLRLFLAVFAAACVGNLYFHFLQEMDVLRDGYAGVISPILPSHAVYTVMLAAGIWWSMVRRQGTSTMLPAGFARLRAIAGVWSFYAVIHIWSGTLGSTGPVERLWWFAGVLSP